MFLFIFFTSEWTEIHLVTFGGWLCMDQRREVEVWNPHCEIPHMPLRIWKVTNDVNKAMRYKARQSKAKAKALGGKSKVKDLGFKAKIKNFGLKAEA